MRRIILASLLIAALAIVPSQPVTASIGLSMDRTFVIPGLQDTILDMDYHDLDGDLIPEVLAVDHNKVVLYSISGDSLLFEDSLHAQLSGARVMLNDIDGDGIVDAIIGAYEIYPISADSIPVGSVTSYNFAAGYDTPVDTRFEFGDGSEWFYYHNEPGVLTMMDTDNDGIDEMVFSGSAYSSTDWGAGMYWSSTVGNTYVFDPYPGSVRVLPKCLSQLTPFAWPDQILGWLGIEKLESDNTVGPDRHESKSLPGIWTDTTFSTRIPMDNCRTPSCYNSTYISFSCGAATVCVGDMLPEDDFIELVAFDIYSEMCINDQGLPEYDGSRWLQMDRLISTDSTVTVWTLDIGEDWIDNLVYLPDYEGYFFGFYNDELTQFVGEDGSINQSTDEVPPGTISWAEPYDDGQPMLIAINGTEVAFYRPDIVTGIFESPEETILPESFVLGQPYPNPFNPTMSVPVKLNQPGHLTVEVFNPLGQRVAVLCDKSIPAGTQRFDWNASNFSSGMYMVKATLGDHTETVKAVLLK